MEREVYCKQIAKYRYTILVSAILLLLITNISYSQIEITTPLWYMPHVGKGAQFSPDGTKILTWGKSGVSMVDKETGRVLFCIAGEIVFGTFDKTGDRFVTTYSDGKVKIWNTSKGEILLNILEHKYEVSTAEFDRTGERLLTGSIDRTAKVFDTKDGKLLFTFVDEDFVRIAKFNNRGTRIITASRGAPKVWNALTGVLMYELKGENLYTLSAEFNDSDEYILTSGATGTVTIWNASDGKVKRLLPVSQNVEPVLAIFNHGGNRVATVCVDAIKIWDISSGAQLNKMQHNGGIVGHPDYSYQDDKIITAGVDGVAKVWESSSGTLMYDIGKKSAGLVSATFGADDDILTTSLDNSSYLWDSDKRTIKYRLYSGLYGLKDIKFSGNDKRIIVVTSYGVFVFNSDTGNLIFEDNIGQFTQSFSAVTDDYGNRLITETNRIKVWDLKGDTLMYILDSVNIPANIDVSPNGESFVVSTKNYTPTVWDTENGTKKYELKGHLDEINFIGYDQSGSKIVTTDRINFIKVWDTKFGNLLYNWESKACAVVFAASNNKGDRIATACSTNKVQIWDIVKGKPLFTLEHPTEINSIVFSPDDKYLIINSSFKWSLWNTETGEKILLPDFKSDVASFHKSSKYIISTNDENSTAVIIEIKTGKKIAILSGHNGASIARFSNDGNKVVTGGSDNTIRLWDISQLLLTTDVENEKKQENDENLLDVYITGNGEAVIIESSQMWDDNLFYTILTPTGEIIEEGAIQNVQGVHNIYLSENISSGVYVMMVRLGGQTHLKKFIITR